MESVRIQTTQNVELEYEIASIGDRILAGLIDLAIKIGYVLALSLLFGFLLFSRWSAGIGTGVLILLTLVVLPYIFYDLLCESLMNGQSFGKKQMQIKVVKLDGTQPTLGSYLLRWLLSFIDCFYYIGLVVILINGKGQRLGDLAAGTTVIKLKQRVTLGDTILTAVEETYIPVFPQANDLTDRDATIIKEVLVAAAKPGDSTLYSPAMRVREILEQKMGVRSEMRTLDFLQTVLKDYNYFKGQL